MRIKAPLCSFFMWNARIDKKPHVWSCVIHLYRKSFGVETVFTQNLLVNCTNNYKDFGKLSVFWASVSVRPLISVLTHISWFLSVVRSHVSGRKWHDRKWCRTSSRDALLHWSLRELWMTRSVLQQRRFSCHTLYRLYYRFSVSSVSRTTEECGAEKQYTSNHT